MRNEFDFLNDVTVNLSSYEETNLTESECNSMKNVIHRKENKKLLGRIGAIAACVALVAAFTQTSFAKELLDSIIKSISTGHNNYYQYDETATLDELVKSYSIFYDRDGNLISEYKDGTVLYDADGNVIDDIGVYAESFLNVETDVSEDGDEAVTVTMTTFGDEDILKHLSETGYTIIRDETAAAERLGELLDFEPQFPAKLPEGFGFLGAAYFENDGKYLFIYYSDAEGNYIGVHERLINEETAISMGTDGEIEETEVNGHKAVLSDGRSLDWEDGDIAIGISGRDVITVDELRAMAESME